MLLPLPTPPFRGAPKQNEREQSDHRHYDEVGRNAQFSPPISLTVFAPVEAVSQVVRPRMRSFCSAMVNP